MYCKFITIAVQCNTNLTNFKGQSVSKNAKDSDKVTISLRLDRCTAEAFKQIAQANNRNQSILIRDWIIDYVKKHRQGELKL